MSLLFLTPKWLWLWLSLSCASTRMSTCDFLLLFLIVHSFVRPDWHFLRPRLRSILNCTEYVMSVFTLCKTFSQLKPTCVEVVYETTSHTNYFWVWSQVKVGKAQVLLITLMTALLSVPVSHDSEPECTIPETKAAKRNSAVINLIVSTCAFLLWHVKMSSIKKKAYWDEAPTAVKCSSMCYSKNLPFKRTWWLHVGFCSCQSAHKYLMTRL